MSAPSLSVSVPDEVTEPSACVSFPTTVMSAPLTVPAVSAVPATERLPFASIVPAVWSSVEPNARPPLPFTVPATVAAPVTSFAVSVPFAAWSSVPSTFSAVSVPSVCVTSAFTVVASTAPAVFRLAAVTVGAVRLPVAATSSVRPAAVTDVAAETVPAMSAPPLSASVPDEATEPPVCVSFPPTVRAPSFATTVPPFCSSSPVTSPTVI